MQPEELPAFILPIFERHNAKWAQDISKAKLRLIKLHAKRMNEFAQGVLAATKDYAPDPPNYSSPPRLSQDNTYEGPNSNHNVNEGSQSTPGDVLHTIGTQTQENKNRKKRACLQKTEDTRVKKIKVTSSSIELYNKYIAARCVRPPKKYDKRTPFVDYGGYHISYEHFCDALKPRGWVDTHTMELYIPQFNLQQTMEACGSALPTKYTFSQYLTLKLIEPEDKFVATKCLREFKSAYQDGSLKSNDLVTNFVTLAAHPKAFTNFDCGIFTMLFMKQWDGKNMAHFCKDTYDHRAIITELIITS
ncbi:hypothetical protein ZWY2020_006350 [Hordeum vulgare]|nr:hypothetical protein ZWY2020_006350 [Hordeum vulgare]